MSGDNMDNKPTGKLYTSNLAGIKNLDIDAEVLMITRAGPDIDGIVRVRSLSPSPELFQRYLNDWKHLNPQEWWHKYKEQFQIELEQKKEALRDIYRELLKGKNVVLVCFCNDHRYCHRRLVGEFFFQYGITVKELNPITQEQLTLF
jgi:uncharacterized protein YeaO (DUF488 family)